MGNNTEENLKQIYADKVKNLNDFRRIEGIENNSDNFLISKAKEAIKEGSFYKNIYKEIIKKANKNRSSYEYNKEDLHNLGAKRFFYDFFNLSELYERQRIPSFSIEDKRYFNFLYRYNYDVTFYSNSKGHFCISKRYKTIGTKPKTIEGIKERCLFLQNALPSILDNSYLKLKQYSFRYHEPSTMTGGTFMDRSDYQLTEVYSAKYEKIMALMVFSYMFLIRNKIEPDYQIFEVLYKNCPNIFSYNEDIESVFDEFELLTKRLKANSNSFSKKDIDFIKLRTLHN